MSVVKGGFLANFNFESGKDLIPSHVGKYTSGYLEKKLKDVIGVQYHTASSMYIYYTQK